MRRALLLAVAATLAAALAAPAPASAAPERQPRVYGGAPAQGNPGVVALAINGGAGWTGLCTAAMWRPRLLLTAAHCVTKSGSAALVDALAVFPPGAPALVYSNIGPQGASPVRPLRWATADGYVNGGGRVTPNDLAVVQLESDLGPAAFTRLASRFELALWTAQQAPAQHVGYGLIGPKQSDRIPYGATLPLQSYTPGGSLGDTFSTAQNATTGLCPGDSGSPVFRVTDAGVFLLGIEVGSNSPCQDPPSTSIFNVSTAANGYLAFLNGQLAAAGYATIPGAPQGVTATARNRDVTVTWQAPTLSPETVVGYDVLDESGAVVCQATGATTCTVSGVPDGTHAYAVRARNADGEGDALPATAAGTVSIAPPAQMAAPRAVVTGPGRVLVRFAGLGQGSAVAQSYVVTDVRGKARCRTAAPAQAGPVTCAFAVPPGPYRFRVSAITPLGASPPSGLSRVVRVPDSR